MSFLLMLDMGHCCYNLSWVYMVKIESRPCITFLADVSAVLNFWSTLELYMSGGPNSGKESVQMATCLAALGLSRSKFATTNPAGMRAPSRTLWCKMPLSPEMRGMTIFMTYTSASDYSSVICNTAYNNLLASWLISCILWLKVIAKGNAQETLMKVEFIIDCTNFVLCWRARQMNGLVPYTLFVAWDLALDAAYLCKLLTDTQSINREQLVGNSLMWLSCTVLVWCHSHLKLRLPQPLQKADHGWHAARPQQGNVRACQGWPWLGKKDQPDSGWGRSKCRLSVVCLWPPPRYVQHKTDHPAAQTDMTLSSEMAAQVSQPFSMWQTTWEGSNHQQIQGWLCPTYSAYCFLKPSWTEYQGWTFGVEFAGLEL